MRRSFSYLGWFVAALACACVSVVIACSSASSGGGSNCNSNPFGCPAGKTCWPADTNGTFQCLPSATGVKQGDACQQVTGTPTCGDFQFCNQTCVSYCDSNHGCQVGEQCVTGPGGGGSALVSVCLTEVPGEGGVGGDDSATGDDSGTGNNSDAFLLDGPTHQ